MEGQVEAKVEKETATETGRCGISEGKRGDVTGGSGMVSSTTKGPEK